MILLISNTFKPSSMLTLFILRPASFLSTNVHTKYLALSMNVYVTLRGLHWPCVNYQNNDYLPLGLCVIYIIHILLLPYIIHTYFIISRHFPFCLCKNIILYLSEPNIPHNIIFFPLFIILSISFVSFSWFSLFSFLMHFVHLLTSVLYFLLGLTTWSLHT